MPEQPATPAPEPAPGLVRTSTNALALSQRTSVAVSLTQLVQREASAAYWFERGQAATQAERWDEAAHAYRQCVERDAEHWRAGVRLAEALGRLGQAEAAAGALTEASEAAMEGWQTLVNELPELTWHHLLDCLEAARSTAQNGFGLLLGLALVYRALKQREQARRTLDVMQFMYKQQVAESAQWFRLSGNLHSDAGYYTEAIKEYDCAIVLTSRLAITYFNRGHAKSHLEDYTGTIADYDCAIALKPNYSAAYHNRGNIKSHLTNHVEAIIDYTQAIRLVPNMAVAYRSRGNVKRSIGDYAGAIADYTHAIEINPYDSSAYCSRGCTKDDTQDYGGAIFDYDKAIEIKPLDAIYYYFRGAARRNLEDYAGAVIDYNQSIKLEPLDPDYYFLRGDAKDELKDYAGAIADYSQAISLKPNDADIYLYRAIIKEKINDTAGAAADRAKAAELELAQQPTT